jgi:hypothetical protein
MRVMAATYYVGVGLAVAIGIVVLVVRHLGVRHGTPTEFSTPGGKGAVSAGRDASEAVRELVIRAERLRELVIRAADDPSDANLATVCRALPSATLFFVVRGAPNTKPGETVAVGPGDVTLPMVRVRDEAGDMVRASVVPPRARADAAVARDDVLASMDGRKLLEMVMKTPADGLAISAEDDRDSWVALPREQISAILADDRNPSAARKNE